jgi:pimeloyl-ACP methyl ester carboxylesterase
MPKARSFNVLVPITALSLLLGVAALAQNSAEIPADGDYVRQEKNEALQIAAKQNETPAAAPLEIKDSFVVADQVKLHYVRAGAGQPVVLLHGNDGTLQDFTMSKFFAQLSRKYDSIAFDRPGHGDSEIPKSQIATPEVQAQLIHSALAQMAVKKPLLVAHSWSSSVALSYALQFPNEISGIVLLGGVAYSTKEDGPKAVYYMAHVPIISNLLAIAFKLTGREQIQKELREAFSPDEPPKPYMEKFLNNMFRTSQLKAAASDELTLDTCLKKMSSNYGKIKTPVVIVCGDADKTVSAKAHSFPLHKAIPHSDLIVLEKAGHELQFSRPTDVIRAIDLAATERASTYPHSNETADSSQLN